MPASQLSRRRLKIHASEPKEPLEELPADDKAMEDDRLAEESCGPDEGSKDMSEAEDLESGEAGEEEGEEEGGQDVEDLSVEIEEDEDEHESKVVLDDEQSEPGDNSESDA